MLVCWEGFLLADVVQSSDGSRPQSKKQAHLNGEAVLREARYFDAVLLDGEILTCKLLQWGAYDLFVETDQGKILLPKHSIKYMVVERYEQDED